MEIKLIRDGLTLRGFWDQPNTEKFDVAIMLHGFLGNCGRSKSFVSYSVAKELNEMGIAVLRVDFNGHGKSDGEIQNMTVWNELDDARTMLDFVRKKKETRNIFLIGHSQGSVIASMLAGFYPEYIRALCLMSPASTLKEDALKGIISNQSYNPNKIPDYVEVMNKKIGSFYFRTAQLLPVYETAANYHGDVCIIHGEADEVVDVSGPMRYHEIYQNSEFHLLKGGNHSLTGESREEAMKLMKEFISAKCTQ